MHNALLAFGITHLINIIGVIGTYNLSKRFGGDYVESSEKFKPYIASIDDQVKAHGTDNAIYLMISMRLMPASPNCVYNVVLPHIKSLNIWHFLAGVAIGQAPANMCNAKAGQILSTLKSKNDIFSREMTLSCVGLAVMFLLPVVYRSYYSNL